MDVTAEAEELLREIGRRRYAGEEVVVDLRPREPRTRWLAKLLAAERAGVQLQLDGERFNPQEDLAREALQEAIGSLRRRAYRAARVHLSEAGARTHDPALDQRVALWRRLADASRAASYTDPQEKLDPEPFAALRELLPKLDRLPDPEREYYVGEADRLQALHAQTAADHALALVWTLSRATLAVSTDEPDAALLWYLRAYSEVAALTGENPPEYVAALAGKARLRVRLLMGDLPPEEIAPARKEALGANKYELLGALTEYAERVIGRAPQPLINAYAPQQYLGGEA